MRININQTHQELFFFSQKSIKIKDIFQIPMILSIFLKIIMRNTLLTHLHILCLFYCILQRQLYIFKIATGYRMTQFRKVTTNYTSYQSNQLPQVYSQTRVTTSRNGNVQSVSSTSQRRITGDIQSHPHNVDWQVSDKMVLSGETDFTTLKHTKQLLLQLIREFDNKGRVVFEGDFKDDFNRRLILLEHQLDGTMRRGLNISEVDPSGGFRTLDYGRLLTQKQNALLDKDAKMLSYQQRMRAAQSKVVGLEAQIQNLTALLTQRNLQIQQLRQQMQLSGSAIDKLKSIQAVTNNSEASRILQAYRNHAFTGRNTMLEKQIAGLQRQVERLNSKSFTLPELQSSIQTWILGLPSESRLRSKLEQGQMRLRQDDRYRAMEEKLTVAGDIYRSQIEKLKLSNPGININLDQSILSTLKSSTSRVSGNINGVVQIEKSIVLTRQLPVQDQRTRHLFRALAMHVRRIHERYPKLKAEMDVKLQQFMTSELVQVLEGQDLDRIIDIVRYVPQTVKVQNVYTYSSDKQRKIQFHLRVLIKALLETMEKAKLRGGAGLQFEIDEGIIGMIRAELIDVLDIDDFLRVYRPVPKVLEVPRVIEKVVDNIVRIPQKYNVSQLQSKTVALQKPSMATDQKLLVLEHMQPVAMYTQKPVEVLSHTQKIVSHPQVHERVAIQVREKTKLQPQDRIIQKIIQREVPVQIQRQKIIIQKEIEPFEVIKEVIRHIQTEKEVIKPIEVIVEKIVEKVIEKETIVQVPQIVQKIVQVIKYEKIPQVVPHIQTRVQIVKQIVQKIVPVIQIQEKIVQVPQIIQKIVTVQKIIQLPPKEIQVIRQVLKIVKEPKIIQRKVTEVIVQKEIQIRQVQRIVQIPVQVPITRIQKQIHQVPVVQTIQLQKHIPVQIIKHVILKQQRPVEVIRNQPHIMREEVPVPFRQQKIIPQEIYYQRIKQVPTVKQKIIEKIVEVPKVVQVQRIVQKIVTVPRIIQKIVQVPQIIQKIVQKVVQIPVQMPPEVHYIPTQLLVQKPVEVQREKIVYITVDQPVNIQNTIMKTDIKTMQYKQIQEIIKERVVVQRQQIPVQVHVDKIVSVPVEKVIVHNIDNVIIHPIEVPVPVTLEKTVPVYVNTETVHVQPVPNIVEKIIQTKKVIKEPQMIPQYQDRVAVQQKVQIVQIQRPYIQQKIKEVKVIQQKIVSVRDTVDRLVEVPYYLEKLVPVIQQIPKIYEYEKEPKVVFAPPTVQIVQKIVPKIINVNKYIEKIVDRLIEVPHLIRQVEKVKQFHEKNVPGPQNMQKALKTVNMQVQKQLIQQKQRIIESKVAFIEETLKTVTQVMERQRDPVIITQDRIIQIPHVMEKIVEKIIVMPQVTQVLKYVTQIIDNDSAGMAVGLDVSVQAQQYKKLGIQLQNGFGDFLIQLGKIKSIQPSAAQRIQLIQQYLAKFRRFIKYPRIHQIIKEKIVQKDKIVKVGSRDVQDSRDDLAKVLLIEKLISQLSRIKRSHPQINLQLDDDIAFIFRLNFEGKVKDVTGRLNTQLKQFENSLDKKFAKMGGWSRDHQIMLKSFLEQRFVLANIVKGTNEEIKASRKQNQVLSAQNARLNAMLLEMFQALVENKNMMPDIMSSLSRDKSSPLFTAYSLLIQRFDQTINSYHTMRQGEIDPTRILGKRFIEELIGSALRQKNMEIQMLKQKLRTGKWRRDETAQSTIIIKNLEYQVERLTKRLRQAQNGEGRDIKGLQLEIERLNKQLRASAGATKIDTSSQQRNLQGQISRLKLIIQQNSSHTLTLQAENKNLNREIESLLLKLKNAEMQLIELRRLESPKRSARTIHSNSPQDDGRRSVVISHVETGEAQDYGENYMGYVQAEVQGAGTIQSYRSGIEQRDMTGSQASYRSGQFITSANFIRGGTSQANGEISRTIKNNETSGLYVSQSSAGGLSIGTTGCQSFSQGQYGQSGGQSYGQAGGQSYGQAGGQSYGQAGGQSMSSGTSISISGGGITSGQSIGQSGTTITKGVKGSYDFYQSRYPNK